MAEFKVNDRVLFYGNRKGKPSFLDRAMISGIIENIDLPFENEDGCWCGINPVLGIGLTWSIHVVNIELVARKQTRKTPC